MGDENECDGPGGRTSVADVNLKERDRLGEMRAKKRYPEAVVNECDVS